MKIYQNLLNSCNKCFYLTWCISCPCPANCQVKTLASITTSEDDRVTAGAATNKIRVVLEKHVEQGGLALIVRAGAWDIENRNYVALLLYISLIPDTKEISLASEKYSRETKEVALAPKAAESESPV